MLAGCWAWCNAAAKAVFVQGCRVGKEGDDLREAGMYKLWNAHEGVSNFYLMITGETWEVLSREIAQLRSFRRVKGKLNWGRAKSRSVKRLF